MLPASMPDALLVATGDGRTFDVLHARDSEGCARVRDVIRAIGSRAVARDLAVPLAWVCSWWFGNRAPDARLRAALSDRFGVPVAAWDRPAPRRRAPRSLLRRASTSRAAA